MNILLDWDDNNKIIEEEHLRNQEIYKHQVNFNLFVGIINPGKNILANNGNNYNWILESNYKFTPTYTPLQNILLSLYLNHKYLKRI